MLIEGVLEGYVKCVAVKRVCVVSEGYVCGKCVAVERVCVLEGYLFGKCVWEICCS